ncbi:MAG: LacI family DNA-binding transcriptional regulator [Ilumatobacter sp.]
MDDVAAAAGVSGATLSRALRGLPNVAASTRGRVVAVAETLGYTADPAASRLAAAPGRTITAVIAHLNSWYFSTIVAGTEAICAEAGYELVGRTAADLFVSLGHERNAVIGWTLGDSTQFEVPQRRLQGCTDGLGAVRLAVQPDVTANGHFSINGGQEAMSSLLDHPEPPSAVFAMSDKMAFGAIMELANRSLVPGRDVSVIGVDDHEFSRVVGLTTIRQTVADHGATAARLLLNTMHPTEDDAAATHRVVPPVELIVRSTTCS